jgi:hypothetical protein
MAYTVALDPLLGPPSLPGNSALANNMRQDAQIIGGSIGAESATTDQGVLRITPRLTASVRYSIRGSRVVGVVVVRGNGWSKTMPFSVDGTPVVRALAAAHLRAHRGKFAGIGLFGVKIKFPNPIKLITAPIRAVVNQASSAIKKATAVAAKLTPPAARNFLGKIVAKAKLAVKTARTTWHKAAELIAKTAKEKALQAAKSIVRSPITAGLLTAVAVAFPPVGAPALATLAIANGAFAALDNAQTMINAVNNVEKTINSLLPAAKAGNAQAVAKVNALRAEVAKAKPQLAQLQAAARPAASLVAQATEAARRGNREARLMLRALDATKRAQSKLKTKIVAAVVASQKATTPQQRAAAEALALRKYLPAASTAIARYHPRIQALAKQAGLTAKQPAPAPAIKRKGWGFVRA